ncbi:MAG: transcriptional repressor LexA [Verrucomicrobiota bacterium]
MLTDRQQQLVDYLRQHHRETGIMPSTREIQHYFGFSSQTAAVSHLRALERKGVIERLPGKARAVIFCEQEEGIDPSNLVEIPVFGRVVAGMAEESDQEAEGSLTVDPRDFGMPYTAKNTFALKVRGDSMIDAHIVDGDYVILENRDPQNRDIVAALIDGETTLKRYVVQRRKKYLRAENPDFPDLIPATELVIQGVMVGLMRTGMN